MARKTSRRTFPRPQPTRQLTLHVIGCTCAECSQSLPSAFYANRTLRTLQGVIGLRIQVRRCLNRGCPHYRHGQRAEEEGSAAERAATTGTVPAAAGRTFADPGADAVIDAARGV